MPYEDMTNEELRDELRDRDLKVSGTKDELVERLEADDEDDSGSDEQAGGGSRRVGVRQAAEHAVRELAALRSEPIEGVTGVRRLEDGFLVTLELLELSRLPHSTDVLGTYEVEVADDGTVLGYERIRRRTRAQLGEELA